ncbi:MAG: RHS repeat-associated core domain-containing protein, partial [Terrisporobacter sp.]
SYTYDTLGRLTKTEINNKTANKNSTVTYGYDKVGNRISMTKDGATTTSKYNNLNQLTSSIENKDGKETSNKIYSYDKNGNKTSQNFIGADGNVIGTTRYSNEGFKYYTYNKDIQGSTTSVVGQDGTSPVAYNYDDFGVTTTIGDKSFFNEVCYTGGIYDVSTGLYYLNARYYDPRNSRFITRDTYRGELNEPDTLHLYAYCANNPINYVDPSGHIAIPLGYGVIVAIAKITATVVVGGMTLYYAGDMAKKLRKEKKGYYVAALKKSKKLKRTDLFIGPYLKTKQAKSRVKYFNGDIWATSESLAYKLAYSIGNRGPSKVENHGKGRPGYYNHYHAKSKNKKYNAHIFF